MDISHILQTASVAYQRPEATNLSAKPEPDRSILDGPAVEISISPQATEMFNQLQSLSAEDTKQLDAIFEKMDKIFTQAGSKPLTDGQMQQLEALDKKIDKILGIEPEEDLLSGLPEAQAKQLDGLFNQIDKLFESADGKPLTQAQEKQLKSLEEKIDSIFTQHEEQSLFGGLSKEDASKVKDLFNQIDKLFEGAGDKPLTREQEKQLEALSNKVEKFLNPEQNELSQLNLSDKAAKQLEKLFEQIDTLFERNQDKPLNEVQNKQLRALEQKIGDLVESNAKQA